MDTHLSFYKAEPATEVGMFLDMDSIAENMSMDPALNHNDEESKAKEKAQHSPSKAAKDEVVDHRPWILDTASSMSSTTTDEVDLMSDLDSLLLSRAQSVSQSLPLHLVHRSTSLNSLGQLLSGIGHSVPCTQNAPLDSSTLRKPSLLGRTPSLPNLAGITAATDDSTDNSPSNSPCNSGGSKASQEKANKYTPEERKAKLERYRQKRSERNFQKKIKYACRKTLADSRPRVRGRFAKNDDVAQHENLKAESHEEIGIRRTTSCTYLTFPY
ncbi:hypothetical protein SELMODRAFT_419178 [Selaginella moellendorffii]|uniref:CCT domain-containing protein n=1 Tax=Selaginella moellendorffii TaxID=88036 RepID=D8S837_SELML|nr:hypothetical protein SELMODRAFT_419178 [Selaginella moellendorffii]